MNWKVFFRFGYGLITASPPTRVFKQNNISEGIWFRKDKSSSMAFPSTLRDRETRCRHKLPWTDLSGSTALVFTCFWNIQSELFTQQKVHSRVCISWWGQRKIWLLETMLATLRGKAVKYFGDDFRIMGNMQDEAMAFMCKWKYDSDVLRHITQESAQTNMM